jgi:hypothetical protein
MDAARRLVKRVEQVCQHGALAGLEDDLRAHAGLQALFSQRLQPLRRDADARQVVGDAVGVIRQQIPGNGSHGAPNHQLGCMREGREPDVHGLTRLDPVDHLWRDSRLQQQGGVRRDDIHDLVSRRDDASRCLEGEAHHLPVGGGLDLGAAQLVAGGNVSCLLGLHIAAHIRKACFHFPAKVLAPCEHALANFRDRALRPDRVAT